MKAERILTVFIYIGAVFTVAGLIIKLFVAYNKPSNAEHWRDYAMSRCEQLCPVVPGGHSVTMLIEPRRVTCSCADAGFTMEYR